MRQFVALNQVPGARTVQLAWDGTPPDSLLRQLIMELWSTMTLERSISWLLNPGASSSHFTRCFVKQRYERFVSSNALEGKKPNEKPRALVIAEFKLRMADDAAAGKKYAETKETEKKE